jgi:hypothetical protein
MSTANEGAAQSGWLKWNTAEQMTELDLRDHLWLLELTPDYEAQLMAIHRVLHRNRKAEVETTEEIQAIEKHAKDAADDMLSQRAVDEWVDRLHHSVYEDAAHSMSAIGLLAPYVESLFHQCFWQIGNKFGQVVTRNEHPRWQATPDVLWNCHRTTDGKVDLTRGILELIDALNIAAQFPADLGKTLNALFGYRNKMFHHGFEWPIEERNRFAKRITDEQWPEGWFSRATHEGQPWIFYMTEAFIEHVFTTIDRVQDGFALQVQDDLLPRLSAQSK